MREKIYQKLSQENSKYEYRYKVILAHNIITCIFFRRSARRTSVIFWFKRKTAAARSAQPGMNGMNPSPCFLTFFPFYTTTSIHIIELKQLLKELSDCRDADEGAREESKIPLAPRDMLAREMWGGTALHPHTHGATSVATATDDGTVMMPAILPLNSRP